MSFRSPSKHQKNISNDQQFYRDFNVTAAARKSHSTNPFEITGP